MFSVVCVKERRGNLLFHQILVSLSEYHVYFVKLFLMDLSKRFFLLLPFTSVEFSLQINVFLLGYGERGAPPKIPGETVLNFWIFYCVRWGFKYSRLHMMGNFSLSCPLNFFLVLLILTFLFNPVHDGFIYGKSSSKGWKDSHLSLTSESLLAFHRIRIAFIVCWLFPAKWKQ